MLSTLLISVYFSCLMGFAYVSHPVICCIMLLISAISVSFLAYSVLGFSWYVVVFCLVYIGGVYVLFIFVSVYSPNPLSNAGVSSLVPVVLFFIFWCVFFGFFSPLPVLSEESFFLSTGERVAYSFFCLILMVGFGVISVVVSSKESFFR
uniref:NADH dehydrogenase subunit 6 n=1 Tax=Echinostoma hortense TaxID=48216 RepID=A0A0M4K794_9TREM|nr:NADH dehydrogenase subunit 6 [Echinostoma hortense]